MKNYNYLTLTLISVVFNSSNKNYIYAYNLQNDSQLKESNGVVESERELQKICFKTKDGLLNCLDVNEEVPQVPTTPLISKAPVSERFFFENTVASSQNPTIQRIISNKPTVTPSKGPTKLPTSRPTSSKTFQPSKDPTHIPTNEPTIDITLTPSKEQSMQPSISTSEKPTNQPTITSSSTPTIDDTFKPSGELSNYPSSSISGEPSLENILSSVSTLTDHLTSELSGLVNDSQLISEEPTDSPTLLPSSTPIIAETVSPSGRHTNFPSTMISEEPTEIPTMYPSNKPTVDETIKPSQKHSSLPSKVESEEPTSKHSNLPTSIPSINGSNSPSLEASDVPTNTPSISPSQKPTIYTSLNPSGTHSIIPSFASEEPTISPSFIPTIETSITPTVLLSNVPSEYPTKLQSNHPSNFETNLPSMGPTYAPSYLPSNEASSTPTSSPTTSHPTPQPILCQFNWNNNACISSLTRDMGSNKRKIFAGEYLCSPNKKFFFGMTLDYQLAMCHGNKMIWSEGPFIDRNPHIVFRRHGALEVHNRKSREASNFKIMWSSETNGNDADLIVTDNGKTQIVRSNGNIEWEVGIPETNSPTSSSVPSANPTSAKPTISRSPIGSETYHPGELYLDSDTGLQLSVGLKARLIAHTGMKVKYEDGSESWNVFHDQPDAGGCFQSTDGGWYYLSNSEMGSGEIAEGGVGRIKFNAQGGIEEYKMILKNTRMNCGSGVTPWNTYISCEEYGGTDSSPTQVPGQCWEVHPEEKWTPRMTQMGGLGGKLESAAFDARTMTGLKGFVTTDHRKGPLVRFTPDASAIHQAMITGDYSNVLHSPGTIDYLVMDPSSQTFHWTTSIKEGMASAKLYFPNGEGIDVHNGILYFVSKKIKTMFILNLDTNEYTNSTTLSGAFDGQPDQIVRLLPPDSDEHEDGLLYFLEDGGKNPAGVFARDRHANRYITIAVGGLHHSDESTGLAFCDHGRRLMFAFQDEGMLYELSREDGKPFHGATVDIKYHAYSQS